MDQTETASAPGTALAAEAARPAPPRLDTDDRACLLQLLDERLRFEQLLSRLSATFINLPAEQVDSQIERGLRQLVEFLDIERSSLGQFSADGTELWVTHSYSAPGFPPFPRVNLAAVWPWYTAQVRQGKVVRYGRLPDELPPEAVREREYCVEVGPRSHLAIPLEVGESLLGAIGFSSYRQERDWPDDLVVCLRLVGEVFANALARKRAEEKERGLWAELAHISRVTLMGELPASIAHELSQPLCAIVSNAQASQRLMLAGASFDRAEVSAALADIIEDGNRASAVIARIRRFLQKAPLERMPVDVNDVLREVSALMRSELARRGVVVALELADRLPAVLGDRTQLQQVIVNLLVNGADALDRAPGRPRRLVLRSGAEERGGVTVAVTDEGVGIDPRHLNHLFDAFFTTKPGSMGMGLAICKSIIELHGGKIWASPSAGRGATFRFTLPGIREGAP
jgi:signal transduction histidine kinase